MWNEGEKFYNYTAWLQYMIKHFFRPWGIELSGLVNFQGEDDSDFGVIEIINGEVIEKQGKRFIPKDGEETKGLLIQILTDGLVNIPEQEVIEDLATKVMEKFDLIQK